jgi:recombination protein RecR
MSYSSKLLQEAVSGFSRLPGVGKKTALRLALYLIRQDRQDVVSNILTPIEKLVSQISFCQVCNNLSDGDICGICEERQHRSEIICVVETIRDVMAIEDTGQFNDLYHVLGGVISPLDGIGPEDLAIDSLIKRVENQNIREVIMAVSPTIEGETTIYYISKVLREKDVKISLLARGISFGGELEYADELTLGRSITMRTPYSQ